MQTNRIAHQGKLAGIAAIALCASVVWPQNHAAQLPPLTAAQIAAEMQKRDRIRAEDLEHYEAARHYEVKYLGFPESLAATMEVDLTYDAASGKTFRIVSQSGSHLLCEEVLKRAVDSEEQAQQEKSATALTTANYRLQTAGTGSVNGRSAYILRVEPLRKGKFLYTGKVWIDAEDFALAQIEAQPAKNPSFWISHTDIHEVYAPVDGFWLPQSNRSETKVRIGGTAIFTIVYGPYRNVRSRPLQSADRR